MTPLYRIFAPTNDNSGRILIKEQNAMRNMLMELVGAYTQEFRVRGAWKDENGYTVTDTSVPYLIATSARTMAKVVARAHEIFPDQKSIFAMEVGTAFYSVPGQPIEVPGKWEPEAPTAFDPCASQAAAVDPHQTDANPDWFKPGGLLPLAPHTTILPSDVIGTSVQYDDAGHPTMAWNKLGNGDVVGPYAPVAFDRRLTVGMATDRAETLDDEVRGLQKEITRRQNQATAIRYAVRTMKRLEGNSITEGQSFDHATATLQEAYAASFAQTEQGA